MLDEFELRLADLIADELAGVQALQLVTRTRSDLGTVVTEPDGVAIIVHTLNADSSRIMGDDALERRGTKGQYRLRTTLRLSGQVAADIAIRTEGGNDLDQRRSRLVQILDALLVALQDETVRNGRAFLTDTDQGFELDGFRLATVAELTPAASAFTLPEGFGAIRATYDFSGRFWPVQPEAEGDAITALPTRIAVMPVLAPERLSATAGAADLTVPLQLDLRLLNGATGRVLGRLKGASPPGSLQGDNAGVPAGWTAFAYDPNGTVSVVYRPPGALGAPARVQVSLALSREGRPSIPLGEFAIQVRPA